VPLQSVAFPIRMELGILNISLAHHKEFECQYRFLKTLILAPVCSEIPRLAGTLNLLILFPKSHFRRIHLISPFASRNLIDLRLAAR
jgi:hypothetical protein